jgi:hypothetical protein
MPGTWSQVLLHIVFSTKDRVPWIGKAMSDDLYGYIGGMVRSEGSTLLLAESALKKPDITTVAAPVNSLHKHHRNAQAHRLISSLYFSVEMHLPRVCHVNLYDFNLNLLGDCISSLRSRIIGRKPYRADISRSRITS